MKKIIKGKYWAVVDKNNDLLHRHKGGSISVFNDKDTAEFLAYDWANPKEQLEVKKVEIKLL